ncbi:MAG TPA: hypothetical protein VGU71_22425 [Candidatus Dormibacteraeota bacterium]|nr:hypothetical protein [Candidatus Dormibacteraeota bacterium]
MKITIESTDRVVELQVHGVQVPARVWEGKTERGAPVAVLVTRIAAHLEDDQADFERDLKETRPPSTHAVEAFPLRLIL